MVYWSSVYFIRILLLGANFIREIGNLEKAENLDKAGIWKRLCLNCIDLLFYTRGRGA